MLEGIVPICLDELLTRPLHPRHCLPPIDDLAGLRHDAWAWHGEQGGSRHTQNVGGNKTGWNEGVVDDQRRPRLHLAHVLQQCRDQQLCSVEHATDDACVLLRRGPLGHVFGNARCHEIFGNASVVIVGVAIWQPRGPSSLNDRSHQFPDKVGHVATPALQLSHQWQGWVHVPRSLEVQEDDVPQRVHCGWRQALQQGDWVQRAVGR
mmetsp:Transcript_98303/g.220301  ORF Transcript_98303/g.220301 Transcript_98303/m.220301 type:complete len:207 (+) Transcript_98303:1046-1666(+)